MPLSVTFCEKEPYIYEAESCSHWISHILVSGTVSNNFKFLNLFLIMLTCFYVYVCVRVHAHTCEQVSEEASCDLPN